MISRYARLYGEAIGQADEERAAEGVDDGGLAVEGARQHAEFTAEVLHDAQQGWLAGLDHHPRELVCIAERSLAAVDAVDAQLTSLLESRLGR